jgi:hypothetical protein
MIDRSELKTMLRGALQQHHLQLTDEQIDQVCTNTLQQTDTNSNGFIEFDEYKALVMKTPRFLSPFTINLPELFKSFDGRTASMDEKALQSKRKLELLKTSGSGDKPEKPNDLSSSTSADSKSASNGNNAHNEITTPSFSDGRFSPATTNNGNVNNQNASFILSDVSELDEDVTLRSNEQIITQKEAQELRQAYHDSLNQNNPDADAASASSSSSSSSQSQPISSVEATASSSISSNLTSPPSSSTSPSNIKPVLDVPKLSIAEQQQIKASNDLLGISARPVNSMPATSR